MKIEIAESLILSYLKHIKKCLIVQTNWKVSSNWDIEETANNQTQVVYDKIIVHPEFSDIFKKSELRQILRQSEVDAIGISISLNKIFLTEIAFHEGGLNYTGGKSETKKRIIKKLLRAYLTALQLFPNYSYEVIFASPKVNPATEKEIKEFFELLNNDFSSEQISFKYFSNEEFEREILLPTIEVSKSEADMSELFMRAIKLVELFNLLDNKNVLSTHNDVEAKPKRRKRYKNISETDKDVSSSERLFSNQEIQRKISSIAKNISEDELELLCKKEESKKLFNLSIPLFIKCPKDISKELKNKVIKDAKGRNRWTWEFEFEFDRNNFIYAITTQWIQRNDIKVKEWLDNHQ
ncbi:MAG: hypothetical protein NTW85_00745 [Methylococcales bacterium]|nr:hypothetical protein [Methylococcales bacterium]